MWRTPKLILECTSNSNFSANHEDNENDQDNENHPDNENEGNYRANQYMLKGNNRKKVMLSLCFEHIWHLVLVFSMSILNMWLLTGYFFSTTNIKDFMFFCIKSVIFLLRF